MKTLNSDFGFSPTRAFTLLELLAVIGILVLLFAILFPAVSKAMGKGDAAKCIANFRIMGQAIILYTTDHDGALPGPLSAGQANFYSIRPNGTVRLQPANLLGYLQPYLDTPPLTPTGKDEKSHPLLCPAWLKQRIADGKNKDGVAFQANNTEFGNASSATSSPLKLMSVERPAALKVAWEIDQLANYNPGSSQLISKPAHGAFRHSLFLDGRVEAEPVEKK